MQPYTLITGANGSIGRALADEFARRGHNLILHTRGLSDGKELRSELEKKYAVEVRQYAADLSVEAQVSELADKIAGDGLPIEYLVNNAGFGDYGKFAEADPIKLRDMQLVNTLALTNLTRQVLPQMINRRQGGILNLASTAAFLPGPLMSVYYATKHYVLVLSVSLNEELKGSGVHVSALCPGPTRGGFRKAASATKNQVFSPKSALTPERVAAVGVKAFLRKKPIIVVGFGNRLGTLVARLLPMTVLARSIRQAQE